MLNYGEKSSFGSDKIHKVLAHSYIFFFIVFLLSLSLDFIFPIKMFSQSVMSMIGIALLVLASALIFWAQKSSRHLEKEDLSKETFKHGPYGYTRSPTHFGLFLLTLGFGFMINAFFVIIFSILSFIISRIIFIGREEKLLAEKYGEPYIQYQKDVKL